MNDLPICLTPKQTCSIYVELMNPLVIRKPEEDAHERTAAPAGERSNYAITV